MSAAPENLSALSPEEKRLLIWALGFACPSRSSSPASIPEKRLSIWALGFAAGELLKSKHERDVLLASRLSQLICKVSDEP